MKKLALFLPLLLLSCAAIRPHAVSPAARELAPLLSQNRCAPHVLMTGHATITVGGERMSARAILLVSRPARLRLTVSDTLGSTLFLATADEERLFYAAPAKTLRETSPRHAGAPIRFGGETYWAEDFVENLPPCLDPALLREGNASYSNADLRHEWKGVKRRWEFYPDGRIKSLSLLRPASAPIRFEFAYTEGDGAAFSVIINRATEFYFTRVTEVDPPPVSAFREPEEK